MTVKSTTREIEHVHFMDKDVLSITTKSDTEENTPGLVCMKADSI